VVVGILGTGASAIVMSMLNMLAAAFITIFVVRLSSTILSNAR